MNAILENLLLRAAGGPEQVMAEQTDEFLPDCAGGRTPLTQQRAETSGLLSSLANLS